MKTTPQDKKVTNFLKQIKGFGRIPTELSLHVVGYREKFRLSTQLHRYIISKRVHDGHISLVPMEGEEALQTLYEVRRP